MLKRELAAASTMQRHGASTALALRLVPAEPAAPHQVHYFCSTPPEAYLHPDRRTLEAARAAAVKDGRHASREACSPLPGRSLTAASTAAHCGGSGPEGATVSIGAVRRRQKSLSDEGSLLCWGGGEGAHSSWSASSICV